jgi:hypothetical protein
MRDTWPRSYLGRWVLALTLVSTLSACSIWKAFTFRSHPYSFVAGKDMMVTVGPTSSMQPEQQKWCSLPTDNAIIGVALAPLISGILSLIIGGVADELNSYYDSKIKEFTQSYSKTVNVPYLFNRNGDLTAQCIVVQLTSIDPNSIDDFDFAARLVPSKPEFKPIALLPRSYFLSF